MPNEEVCGTVTMSGIDFNVTSSGAFAPVKQRICVGSLMRPIVGSVRKVNRVTGNNDA